MLKKYYSLFLLFFFTPGVFSQTTLPASYESTDAEKIEAYINNLRRKDSIELEKLKAISIAKYKSASNQGKIKMLALDIALTNRFSFVGKQELGDVAYTANKLADYFENYGVLVYIKFPEESYSHLDYGMGKIFISMFKGNKTPLNPNYISLEISGGYDGDWKNEISYKVTTNGVYSEIAAINGYSKTLKGHNSEHKNAIFEDLDKLILAHSTAFANLLNTNASVYGGNGLAEAMRNAGANSCAFCKECSVAPGQSGQGAVTSGDGYTAPMRIMQNNVFYNCVVVLYNPSNSSVQTFQPNSQTSAGLLSNPKINIKGSQFIILRKPSQNGDELITCVAAQQYNTYCSDNNPFADVSFKEKIAAEISQCAQNESSERQASLEKYQNLPVKVQTYVYDNYYLITKIPNGATTIEPYTQAQFNQFRSDLKSNKLSNGEAVLLKKTNTGYFLAVNYGQNVVPKTGYDPNGDAKDRSEVAIENVMNEFLRHKQNLSLPDIQLPSETFEDGKRIDVKESTFWNKVQDVVIGSREFIENAQIPEKYYNSSTSGYSTNWINTPPLLSGVGNGVIEEIKEIPQLVFLGCDIATKQEVRDGIRNALKNFECKKIAKAAGSTLTNWVNTYGQGGDGAWHQGGKDAVMVFSMLSPGGLIKKTDGALGKNVEEVAEKVRKKATTLSLKEIDDLVIFATKQNDKLKVMLGKFDGGTITGYISRAGTDFSYFDMGDKWDEVLKSVADDFDEMWKINKKFIDNQRALNKEFYLSHTPIGASGFYFKEISYLTKSISQGGLGGTIVSQGDNLWKIEW